VIKPLLCAFAVGLVCASAVAAPIFTWVDRQGGLHATDRLQDVPEPYYSMYAAELKAREQKAGATPVPPAAEAAAPPTPRPVVTTPRPAIEPVTAAGEAKRRQTWRDLVAQWRRELAAATANLQKITQELDEAQLNPVLRVLPANQERINDLMSLRTKAQDRVEKARLMLVDDIPKRARAEGVPPLWLL
jgi:hypothetical protein